jgi:hypothetical protein
MSARYPRVHRVGPLARGVTIASQYLHRGHAVLGVRLTISSAQAPYAGGIAILRSPQDPAARRLPYAVHDRRGHVTAGTAQQFAGREG